MIDCCVRAIMAKAAPLLVLAIFFGVAINPATAQDADARERLRAATELVAVSSKSLAVQVASEMMNAHWLELDMAMRAHGVDAVTITDLHNAMLSTLSDFVTPLFDKMPAIYAQHFTMDELRALTAFYSTPAGEKSLMEMPKLMGDIEQAWVPLQEGMLATLSRSFAQVFARHGYCGSPPVKCQ